MGSRRRPRNLRWSSRKERKRRELRRALTITPAPAAATETDSDNEMGSAANEPTIKGDCDDEHERYLRMELDLKRDTFEKLILEKDNARMKEELEDLGYALQEKQAKIGDLEVELKSKENDKATAEMKLRWEKERSKDKQKGWDETKGFLKQLFEVAKTVLEGLGGSAPSLESLEEEDGAETMERFCRELQQTFKDWHGGHQLMHNQMERTLAIVEEFGEEVIDRMGALEPQRKILMASTSSSSGATTACPPAGTSYPAIAYPSTSTRSTTSSYRPSMMKLKKAAKKDEDDGEEEDDDKNDDPLGLKRRNPSRKCKEGIDSYREETSSIFSEQPSVYSRFPIGCGHCGDAFCRFAHISSRLAGVRLEKKKKKEAVVEETVEFLKPTGPAPKPRRTSRTPKPSKRKLESEEFVVSKINKSPKKEEPGTSTSSTFKLEVVEPSGQEHKPAGSYLAPVPSEQKKCLQEGIPPIIKQRYFCKCGKHYAERKGLLRHIRKVASRSSSQFQCGLCHEGFKLQAALETHMKDEHRVVYSEDRFSCLLCGGKTFVGTMKEVKTHFNLYHGTEDDDEDDYF